MHTKNSLPQYVFVVLPNTELSNPRILRCTSRGEARSIVLCFLRKNGLVAPKTGAHNKGFPSHSLEKHQKNVRQLRRVKARVHIT